MRAIRREGGELRHAAQRGRNLLARRLAGRADRRPHHRGRCDRKRSSELVPEELAGNWQQSPRFPRRRAEGLAGNPRRARQGRRGRGPQRAAAAAGGDRRVRLWRPAGDCRRFDRLDPRDRRAAQGHRPAAARRGGAAGARYLVHPDRSTSACSPARPRRGTRSIGLMKLLRTLEPGVGEVVELAGENARTALVRAALAPASETPAWPIARVRTCRWAAALDGVSILAARNADIEARAIALAARATLAERKSVGIVTRDQTLARRIAVELKRHGIEVDDAAGTPLFQSAAGRLARQVLAVAADNYAPVDIMALLRNAAVTLGLDRFVVAEARRPARPAAADGARPPLVSPGLRDLSRSRGTAAAARPAGRRDAAGTCDWASASGSLRRDLAAALLASIDALIGDAELPGMTEFRRWAEELVRSIRAAPPSHRSISKRCSRRCWPAARPQAPVPAPRRHPYLGRARSAAAEPGPDDPCRAQRGHLAAGRPIPARGSAAACGSASGSSRPSGGRARRRMISTWRMGNAEVIIAYAERIGTSPGAALAAAAAARCLYRRGRGQDAAARVAAAGCAQARGDRPCRHRRSPAQRPVPNPPASIRPRRLSITEIETLMRSPYDIYAKHVLRAAAARAAWHRAQRPRARHDDPRRVRAASSGPDCDIGRPRPCPR